MKVFQRYAWAKAPLLVALLLIVYAPALHGGFLWDDDDHISANRALVDPGGLHDIWLKPGATVQYYPLTFTAFWIGRRLWGLDTLGYHLLNVALHATAALLLWRLLWRLRVPGAWTGACLFALHPVNVMSVAWMTELKNTLSASLALGAALAYVSFAGIGAGGARDDGDAAPAGWGAYPLAAALFAAAMLAKTAVVFLPVTLALIVWWRGARVPRARAWSLVPFAVVGLAMGALTVSVERIRGGDVGSVYTLSVLERLIVSGRSFWFYVAKLVVPYPLIFIYPRWTIDAASPIQYLPAVGAAVLLAVLFAFRARIGKGPFVAVAHFFIATSALIFFVVTFFTRYSFVSDHWQYFGIAGLAALGGAGLAALGSPWRAAVTAIVLAIFSFLTWRQAASYRDVETLYRATIAANPGCWMCENNLGELLMRTGRKDEAKGMLLRALATEPGYADAHLNLGSLLMGEGDTGGAIEHLRKAEALSPRLAAVARYDVANTLAGAGRIDEAIAEYESALRARPDYSEALFNLGLALAKRGRFDEAIARYEAALRLDPSLDFKVAFNKARALAGLGRLEGAIAELRHAVSLRPDDAEAHNDLGVALAASGHLADARDQFREALRLRPEFADARDNLARAEGSLSGPR